MQLELKNKSVYSMRKIFFIMIGKYGLMEHACFQVSRVLNILKTVT